MVSAGADSSLRAALPGLVAQLPRRDAEEPGSRSGGEIEIAERSQRRWPPREIRRSARVSVLRLITGRGT
jgi:hypothetical protein